MYVCACVHECTQASLHGVHGEVKERLVRVSSLLPPGRSWGFNSGCQAWTQTALPSALSPQP